MAGVGRTGTLIALINSIITLDEQKRVRDAEAIIGKNLIPDATTRLSIFSIVRRLRE